MRIDVIHLVKFNVGFDTWLRVCNLTCVPGKQHYASPGVSPGGGVCSARR